MSEGDVITREPYIRLIFPKAYQLPIPLLQLLLVTNSTEAPQPKVKSHPCIFKIKDYQDHPSDCFPLAEQEETKLIGQIRDLILEIRSHRCQFKLNIRSQVPK